MQLDKPQRQRVVVLSVIVLVLLSVILAALDWHNVRQLMGEAEWELSLVALLFIAIAYVCLGYGFVVVTRLFGIQMRQLEVFKIGYVTTALNNMLAFLGAAGHSLRVMLMQRQQVSAGQVLAASLFHSHFHNLVMFCLAPLGLIYLLVQHTVHGSAALGLGLATGLLLLLVAIATAVLFVRSLRLRIARILARVSRVVARRDISPFLDSLNDAMSRGVAAARLRPLAFVLVLALVAAEWAFAIGALWFCFDALGQKLSIGVLVTGYAVGVLAGNLSMVPGGLGVQEGSMTGIYVLLGVPFDQSVLASILFRVIYDFIPFFVSLVLYRGLLRASKQAATSTSNHRHTA